MTALLLGYDFVTAVSKRLYKVRRGNEHFLLKTYEAQPPEAIARASKLQGPWVAELRDIGLFDTRHAVVSEWVEGIELSGLLGQGALPQPVALHIAFEVARALTAAHELDDGAMVHGALDPSHVLLRQDGAVKVCNFGGGVRRDGLLRAHRGFVAPEVLAGGEADVLSDVYACGALVYLLLTGKTPAEAALSNRGVVPPPSRLQPGLDDSLDATLLELIASDPAERAISVRGLTGAIDTYTEDMELELGPEPLAELMASMARARAA
ncbi:MAG: protein kinase [Myxococcaceae bacterium]|nr:protein kinase [Myxococcaceae bacterium]